MLDDIYYLFLLSLVMLVMPVLAIKSSQALVHILRTRPEIKASFYLQGIVIQWLLTAAVLLGMWFKQDQWTLIGITTDHAVLWLVVLLLMVITSLLFFRRATLGVVAQARIQRLYQHVAHYLPTNEGQYRWGVVLSLTAGICEEIVYRGFVFWRLSSLLGVVPAMLLTNLVFALAHVATGVKNCLLSFVLGLVFSLLYLYTGDLWLSIACHVAIDLLGITLYPKMLQSAARTTH